MKYCKLEYYVSQPRLNRFFVAGGNSKVRAQKLYLANLRVCQAFYPVLNLFEVFLRNTCYNHLSVHFADPNWIVTEKADFMGHESLRPSNYFLKKSVDKAKRSIMRKGGVATAGKVMAEQSFGFWTSLFDTHHYRLIGGAVIHCFPNKPTKANRSILSQKLNRVRDFRNRVYHNEPVCFNGHIIDFATALAIRNEIYELLDWMETDLSEYVKTFDNIRNKINVALLC